MVFELVIDTRTLVDASSEKITEDFVNASLLIDLILDKNKSDKKIAICVDSKDGENGLYDFSDPGINSSLIIREYVKELGNMKRNDFKIGWHFLIKLDQKKLIHTKNRRVSCIKKHNFIRDKLRNRRDSTFVCVTCNSNSGALVSDEEKDFSKSFRTLCRGKPLQIHILFTHDNTLKKHIISL